MANYKQPPYLDPTEDLTNVAYANTERLFYNGVPWVRVVGSIPSSNTNLYRPGPSGSYWAREFTPIDFGMTSGRNARETVLLSYDFNGPAGGSGYSVGPFYTFSAGSQASAVGYNASIDSSPYGLIVSSMGSTASGSTWIGTHNNFYTPGQNNRIAVEAVYAVPVFSTAGVDEFADVIGLCSSLTATTNVIGFRVDTAASTARVISGGSTSGTPLTALTQTANTRYRARVEHYYSAGAYSAKFYMRAEPSYVSPREWPWTAGDVIGTITDGTSGVTFPTGVTYGVGNLMRKIAGTSIRTNLVSQIIVSTGF